MQGTSTPWVNRGDLSAPVCTDGVSASGLAGVRRANCGGLIGEAARILDDGSRAATG